MTTRLANESSAWGSCFNPLRMSGNLWTHRGLIWQLTRREVSGRYRGTYLGLLWSFVNPLLMLAVYTFAFAVIFGAKWPDPTGQHTGRSHFALMVFAGLVPFNVFSEVVNRAPTLVLAVPNYVKKVIFPLEILPMVLLGSAIIHSLVSVVILLAGSLLLEHSVSASLTLLPLAYVPLIFLCLGLGWLLASLGTYMRDLAQGVAPAVQILMFLTPIFYPPANLDNAPILARRFMAMNPLTLIVGGFHQVLMGDGRTVGTPGWLICTALSALVAVFGYGWFIRTKRGFADVL